MNFFIFLNSVPQILKYQHFYPIYMIKRIRIYNSKDEYFTFSSKDDLISIHKRRVKVVKYLTKKIKGKKYYSGKLILPTKLFNPDDTIGSEYALLKLSRTHIICRQEGMVMDTWGYSYLLFLKKPASYVSKPILFDTKNLYITKRRKGFSKVMKHKRKANGKIYYSPKICVLKELIGKKLILMKLNKPIKLKHREVIKEPLFQTSSYETKLELGRGYILFYKDPNAKKPLEKSFKKVISGPAYRNTLFYINKGKTIFEISEILDINPTSVWNHVCIAFKEGEISPSKLKSILINRCDEGIRNDLIIFLENIRSQELKELQKMRKITLMEEKYYGILKKDKIRNNKSMRKLKLLLQKETVPYAIHATKKELESRFYEKHKKHLPMNMVEAMLLYLNWLYKGK